MPQDLRAFLELAESRNALVRIPRAVDAITQAGELLRELERRNAVGLFEHIANRDGRLVGNLLGRRDLLAEAMGIAPSDLVTVFGERIHQRVPPETLHGPAPVHEVVLNGSDADLSRLPLVVHATKDAGAYVTAGVVIARDPRSG